MKAFSAARAAGPDVAALLTVLAHGAPVSGARLAASLGVTRAAVWKQIEALRAAGLSVAARPGLGYALETPLELLDARAIRTTLASAQRKRLGLLETHWRIDSTSSECLRRANALPDRAVVLAEQQTAGRGRRGRVWLSPPALNLYLSIFNRFDGGFAGLSGLSLAAGVALARALEGCGVQGVQLKWPNDAVAGGAKLAGILVELGGEFLGPCFAVIGVGVNLHLPPALRARAGQSVTDLAELCGGAPPARNRLAAALIGEMLDALDAFARDSFAVFVDDYARRDALRGKHLRLDDPRGAFDGVGAGVDARGALRVRTAQGVRTVDSADVSVRPA